ncbi:hypothetical protein EIP91_001620 [Steccherinum ochraceum]|uniref:F-box domain-containing protein n=1 Tax=Steccherinum ochraceum TaxID=92696 RepID=A0A4V2MWH2_9APHY|nr:hypothetical protein EIP91_001620 [Steccherinum ochraceum]
MDNVDDQPRLPPELVDYVLDYLHDDKTTLIACASVSKSWVDSSRYHLFSTINFTLETPFCIGKLIRFLKDVQVNHYIRNFSIIQDHSVSSILHFPRYPSFCPIHHLPLLLPSLPSLRCLTVTSAFVTCDCTEDTIEAHNRGPHITHNLKELSISNAIGNTVDVLGILNNFASIDVLSVWRPVISLSAHRRTLPLNTSLARELQVRSFKHFAVGVSMETYILLRSSPSVDTLHTLKVALDDSLEMDSFMKLVAKCTNLRALDITPIVNSPHPSFRPAQERALEAWSELDFKHCTNLHSFSLRIFPFVYEPENPRAETSSARYCRMISLALLQLPYQTKHVVLGIHIPPFDLIRETFRRLYDWELILRALNGLLELERVDVELQCHCGVDVDEVACRCFEAAAVIVRERMASVWSRKRGSVLRVADMVAMGANRRLGYKIESWAVRSLT